MSDCTCQRCMYAEPTLIESLAKRPAKAHIERSYCRCGHSAENHDIVKRHNGCDIIGCNCLSFNLRSEQETP